MGALEDLTAAYTNVCARVKEVTEEKKPTYTIDGQTVLWGQYLTKLMETARALRDEIDAHPDSAAQSIGDEHTLAVPCPPGIPDY